MEFIELIATIVLSGLAGFVVGAHFAVREGETAIQNVRSHFLYEIKILTKRIRELENNYYGKHKS